MQTDSEHEPEILEMSSRQSLLAVGAQLITQLQKKATQKRFRANDRGDSLRLGYLRCLVSAIGMYNQVLRDAEVSELKKELDEVRGLVESINGRSK